MIGRAIASAKQTPGDVDVKAASGLNGDCSIFLRIFDLTTEEFQQHFSVSWTEFHAIYGRTRDVWSAGFMELGLQNKALDLALISLATMRLSMSKRQSMYLVFSLSAYNVPTWSLPR